MKFNKINSKAEVVNVVAAQTQQTKAANQNLKALKDKSVIKSGKTEVTTPVAATIASSKEVKGKLFSEAVVPTKAKASKAAAVDE